MWLYVLGFILIAILAVMRFMFDMKYTLPVMGEHKDLAVLNKIGYGVVAVIFICILFRQKIPLIISLVLGVPFLIYWNYKVYYLAIRKFLGK